MEGDQYIVEPPPSDYYVTSSYRSNFADKLGYNRPEQVGYPSVYNAAPNIYQPPSGIEAKRMQFLPENAANSELRHLTDRPPTTFATPPLPPVPTKIVITIDQQTMMLIFIVFVVFLTLCLMGFRALMDIKEYMHDLLNSMQAKQ